MSKFRLKIEISQGPIGWNWVVWGQRGGGRWKRYYQRHSTGLREATLESTKAAERLAEEQGERVQ